MSGMLTVTALTISAASLGGLALALLGRLRLALALRGASPEDEWLRGALRALPWVLLPLTVLTGLLVDLAGPRWVAVGSSVALALGLFGLGPLPSSGRAVASGLVAALGAAGLAITGLALLPRAIFGAEETAASLYVGTVFIALGTLCAATLADVFFRSLGRQRALVLVAFLCLVPAFLAALPSEEQLPGPTPEALDALGHLGLWLDLGLAGLVLFFYAPLEASVSLWVTTRLMGEGPEQGLRRRWLLPTFWGLLLASRLALGLVGHTGQVTDPWTGFFLVIPAALVPVLLGNVAGLIQLERAAGWMLVLGALMGPIYPALLALVSLHSGGVTGLAYGVLLGAGTLGALLCAPLLPPHDDLTPAQSGLRVPLVLGVLLAVAALAYGLAVA